MQAPPAFDEIRVLGSGAFGTVTEVRLKRSAQPTARTVSLPNIRQEIAARKATPVRQLTWRKKFAHRCKLLLCRSGGRSDVPPAQPVWRRDVEENRFALKTIRSATHWLENEHRALVTLRDHPHVIKLHDRYFDESSGSHSFLFELCRGGDLLTLIEEDSHVLMRSVKREQFCRQICQQVGGALQQAHSQLIIHRDVKLENIFFRDSSCRDAVLGDWGLAVVLSSADEQRDDPCGSVHYAAPELILHGDHSFGVDMWSLGVVCFAVLTGRFPFYGETAREIQTSIVSRDAAPLPTWVSPECQRCVRRMLTHDPAKRITSTELLQDLWLQDDSVE